MSLKAGVLLVLLLCASAPGQRTEREVVDGLFLRGRFDEADKWFSTPAARQIPADESYLLVWKADVEIERGRFGEAAVLIAEAKRRASSGDDALIARREARLLLATGRLAESWKVALEGRQWDGKEIRRLKVSSTLNLVTIGEILLARGEYAEAIPVFDKARRQTVGLAAEVPRARNGIARGYLASGSLREAAEAAAAAFSDSEQAWGTASIPAMDAADTIGLIRAAESKLDDAEESLSEALSWRENVYGRGHPKVAQSYIHLGCLAAARKEPERAAVLVNQGLEIERALATGPNARWALALVSGAECLAAAGHAAEAVQYYQSAIPVLERELGPDAPRLANVRKQLSALAAK